MDAIRCCVSCRKRKYKNELIRIVTDKDGNAIYDKEQKINSRAIYICKDKNCLCNLKKCITKNKFKTRIHIKTDSLIELIEKLEVELGE